MRGKTGRIERSGNGAHGGAQRAKFLKKVQKPPVINFELNGFNASIQYESHCCFTRLNLKKMGPL